MKMKLDNLCRVVIPKKLRQELNITANSVVELTLEGGAITLRLATYTCKLCGEPLSEARSVQLCDRCIDLVKQIEV